MRPIFISIIFLIVTNLACAELPISVNLKMYETYVDNIFQTSDPDSDYVTLLYLDLDYTVEQNTTITYNSNANFFYKYTDLHNQAHYLSLEHEKNLLQNKGRLYFGTGLGLHDNRELYSFYDHHIVGSYIGFKYHLTETTSTQMEYQIDLKNYPGYPIYNSLENYGYLQLSKSFQTSRTTIQTRIDLGRRIYTNNIAGKNYIDQVTGSIKIAQSLTDLTGLQLKYSQHHASPFPFEDSFIQDYYTNEFEDDYNYSGKEIRLTLKHITPWNVLLKTSLIRKSKLFNALSFGTDGQTRKDSNTDILIEIEKQLSSFNGMSLYLEFLRRKNNSNDQYHDFSISMFSTGMKFVF
ncbi:MAG: hypothetical protein ACUVWN_17815 [bacterium]